MVEQDSQSFLVRRAVHPERQLEFREGAGAAVRTFTRTTTTARDGGEHVRSSAARGRARARGRLALQFVQRLHRSTGERVRRLRASRVPAPLIYSYEARYGRRPPCQQPGAHIHDSALHSPTLVRSLSPAERIGAAERTGTSSLYSFGRSSRVLRAFKSNSDDVAGAAEMPVAVMVNAADAGAKGGVRDRVRVCRGTTKPEMAVPRYHCCEMIVQA